MYLTGWVSKMRYKIFVINPGSTSTKLAYFEDEDKLFETSVFHDAPFLASLGKVSNQFEYRLRLIKEFIDENGIDLRGVDAIVGRGGSNMPCVSGTYEVNDKLLEDNLNAVSGVDHPANLHALNLKGTVRMHCRNNGVRYEDGNYIVCHIDGGMTVSAHDHGRMIDATNNAGGEGPFTPTRTGALPVSSVIDYFFDNGHRSMVGIEETDYKDFESALRAAREVLTRNAGLTGHFGVSSAHPP